jgi:hypothetical protein
MVSVKVAHVYEVQLTMCQLVTERDVQQNLLSLLIGLVKVLAMDSL